MIQLLNGRARRQNGRKPATGLPSLKEVFESFFIPALKLKSQDLEPAIDQYLPQSPDLKKYSRPSLSPR